MASSETQFQPATIQATGYSPSEYRPVSINVPTGAGQLWAGVGKTALDAASQFNQTAQMMQQSPLNPAVHAQMDYNVAQYDAAQQHIKDVQAMGPLGQVVQKTGPQGLETVPIASIQDPTLAARLTAQMGLTPKPGGGGSGPPPTVNNPAVQQPASPQDQGQSDLQQHPENYFLNPATGSYERRADAPPIQAQPQQVTPQQKGPPTPSQMVKPQASAAPAAPASMSDIGLVPSQGGSTAASTAGGPGQLNTGQPQDPDIVATPAQQPSGSIWNPMRPAPAAPPAPGAPPTPPAQPAQGQSPAAATQADQAAMQQWQQQNAHPVMSSQDALSWMKQQSTLAQDATYLPMGGPGGAPAFAFHMKGGGINTVPVSQMVSRGAGPLVAAQNTSQVISATDQQQQGGDQGQPPVAQTPPNISPPPPANLPPPAPAGPSQNGQVYNPLPPSPGPNAPPAPGDYNPAPYRNAVAQATANPQNLMAQTAPAGQPAQTGPAPGTPINPPPSNATVSQEDQNTIQASADKMGEQRKYTGDRPVPGNTGPYTYYRDDDPNSPSRGRVYTTLPGPAGQYFNQQRWYLGSTGYQPYELPDSAARQQMWDKWGTKGYLTRDDIATMTPQQMEPWLQRAWQNDTFQRSSPTDGLNKTLDTSEQLHNSLQKISDIQQALAANGITNLNSTDLMRAKVENAKVAISSKKPWMQEDQLQRTGNVAGAALGLFSNMDENSAAAIRTLDEETNKAQQLLKDHPELLMPLGQAEGQETPNIHLADWVRLGLPNIPASNVLSDSAFSGQDLQTRLRNLKGLQTLGDNRYKSLVDQAQTQWMRIDPKHDANLLKLGQNRDLVDDSNDYRSHVFKVTPDQYPEYAKAHPGTLFMGADGQVRQTPANP